MASAVYKSGDKTITLSITELGAAGALASLADSLGENANEMTDHGYRRLGSVDGRMTLEEIDLNENTGIHSFMVGEKLLVKAEGRGASMNELKAATGSIDSAQLEALAQD